MNWSAWAVEVEDQGARQGLVLVSAEAPQDTTRAPVLLNLVLDRSGSMKGAPLSAAVEAAWNFVELAKPEDYVGLLLFDGVVEQRVPVCAMDAKGKRLMEDALTDVRTGRGTALYQAVEAGARALQRVLVPGRRPRLLLLTDGEPSVGPEDQASFDALGAKLADQKIGVHALGLARHYVAEILSALTLPSGTAYEHVDGPEGLAEAMGGIFARLFGEAAAQTTVSVTPEGFHALTTRHAFPTRAEGESLVVALGDVSKGLARRVLLAGPVVGDWSVKLQGSSVERGDTRQQTVPLEKVAADSPRGRLIRSLDHELELVSEETAAWLSLARRDLDRAEAQLESAEGHAKAMATLAADAVPVKRHQERLADLRLAIERGEGDIPLLIRRAKSAHAETAVSQVIPLAAVRGRK